MKRACDFFLFETKRKEWVYLSIILSFFVRGHMLVDDSGSRARRALRKLSVRVLARCCVALLDLPPPPPLCLFLPVFFYLLHAAFGLEAGEFSCIN